MKNTMMVLVAVVLSVGCVTETTPATCATMCAASAEAFASGACVDNPDTCVETCEAYQAVAVEEGCAAEFQAMNECRQALGDACGVEDCGGLDGELFECLAQGWQVREGAFD